MIAWFPPMTRGLLGSQTSVGLEMRPLPSRSCCSCCSGLELQNLDLAFGSRLSVLRLRFHFGICVGIDRSAGYRKTAAANKNEK